MTWSQQATATEMDLPPSAPISEPAVDSEAPAEPPLSKNAQKRILKAAKRMEFRLVRRAKERQARKAKKRARAIEEAEQDPSQPISKKPKLVQTPFDARIVVDLAFDELMSAKVLEINCFSESDFVLNNTTAPGVRLSVFSAWIHLFVSKEIPHSFLFPRLHFTGWSNKTSPRARRARVLPSMERDEMVGGELRKNMDS